MDGDLPASSRFSPPYCIPMLGVQQANLTHQAISRIRRYLLITITGGNMENPVIVKKQKLKKGRPESSEFHPSDIKESIEKTKKSLSEKQRNNARTEFIEVE
ncbi:hypothetical protein ACL7TT_07460 [Microbulbifer sp. 2304DJ12-6]|uniref:hypothetical protein n=1 Tax=Microbulbifer sp. 2304DJ12-6 TaxID=3233340 RepID=UPI0039AF4142